MATISLCMIVKNEEAVLKRCLDSLRGLMDEIIIVDTGSTDRTKEIAAAYTDKICDFTWEGDFSAARNYSFSLASMEYIYTADADEVLDEENRKRFLELKRALLPEIEIVQMWYCNQLSFNTTYNFDEEYRPKLYKRIRSFHWEEPVHEQVRLEPVVFDSDIRIRHCPVENHGRRDFSLFEQYIEKGNRLSRRLHGLYARELYIAGSEEDFLRAERYFKEAAADAGRSLEEAKESACVLTRAARIRKDVGGILKYAAKELCTEPSSEICCELGQYYADAGDEEEAVLWFYNASYEVKSLLDIRYEKEIPLKGLETCYQKLGNEPLAEYYRREQCAESEAKP